MKKMKKLNALLTILLLSIISINVIAQKTFVIQPGPEEGKDAFLSSFAPDRNHGNHFELSLSAWTCGGSSCNVRQLLQFDLTEFPEDADILNATLCLYNTPYSSNGHMDGKHIPTNGTATGIIQRAISSWDEKTVTWNTKPSTTTQNQVLIPGPTSSNQDYELDVTNLVQDMINDPDNSYGFMLKLVEETYYRIIVLASSDCPDSTLWPKLVIEYEENETQVNLEEGLVAYYPFNGNANDESGNGNDGVLYGAILSNDRLGNVNSAYYFDGVNDYIYVKNAPELQITGQITMSAWFKTGNVLSFAGIICKATPVEPRSGYVLTINEYDKARADVCLNHLTGQCGAVVSENEVDDDVWHHMLATYDGTILKLYIDNVLVDESEYYDGININNEPLLIGWDQNTWLSHRHFQGIIDEVRIYNRALNEKEIATLSDSSAESEKPIINFAATNSEVKENAGNATISIESSFNLINPVTVNYQIGNTSTATVNEDFVQPIGEIVMPTGANIADIVLNIIDDKEYEADETIIFELLEGEGYVLGENMIYTITIPENDLCQIVNIAVELSALQNEGYGTEPVVFLGYEPLSSLTLLAKISGGTEPYALNWSSGENSANIVASPVETSEYILIATDAIGCVGTNSIIVNVEDVRCGKKLDKVVVCQNADKKNPHDICISPNAVPAHLAQGSNLGSCSYNEKSIDAITTISQNLTNSVFNIFPNPSGSASNLEFTGKINEILKIEIMDISGQNVLLLFNGSINAGQAYNIVIPQLKAGMYIIRMTSNNNIDTQKIIFK